MQLFLPSEICPSLICSRLMGFSSLGNPLAAYSISNTTDFHRFSLRIQTVLNSLIVLILAPEQTNNYILKFNFNQA